ncbi:hypothetical protein HK104_007025 [Borealophlyctis nickersoniae]|nr:hypothetical protein HK104_007025 [Borealophlyctis nickersoniae]
MPPPAASSSSSSSSCSLAADSGIKKRKLEFDAETEIASRKPAKFASSTAPSTSYFASSSSSVVRDPEDSDSDCELIDLTQEVPVVVKPAPSQKPEAPVVPESPAGATSQNHATLEATAVTMPAPVFPTMYGFMPFPSPQIPPSMPAARQEPPKPASSVAKPASPVLFKVPEALFKPPPSAPTPEAEPGSNDNEQTTEVVMDTADLDNVKLLEESGVLTADAIQRVLAAETVDQGCVRIVDDLKRQYGRGGTPDGLRISLMEHQVQGLAWMIRMEEDDLAGGILADDMGLGKTIQTIALIVHNRAPLTPKRGGTLIVAPLALLTQWRDEIDSKTSCGLKVFIYHGDSRKNRTKKDLRQYDGGLTTYGVLANESPREAIIGPHFELIKPSYKGGTIFRARWHRVVLDEAQYIKNRLTSRPLRVLPQWDSHPKQRRRSLQPLPLPPRPELERLSLLPRANRHADNFEADEMMKIALRRLRVVLRTCLLRRTKASKDKNGEPILKLCPRIVEMVEKDFSPPERDFYTAVETSSQVQFGKYLKTGTIAKNYANILVLLLRLRQALEPNQNPSPSDADAAPERQPQPQTDLDRARTIFPADTLTRLLDAAKKPSGEGHILDDLCPICTDVLDRPVVPVCGHPFCRDCIEGYFEYRAPAAAAAEDGEEVVEKPCPLCRTMISAQALFPAETFFPTGDDAGPSADDPQEDKKPVIEPERLKSSCLG